MKDCYDSAMRWLLPRRSRVGATVLVAALWLHAGITGAGPAPASDTFTIAWADFGTEKPSHDARRLADWVVRTHDHKGLPFVLIDKINARLYAFDTRGVLMRATPVLIGMAKGDLFPPGVAQLDMSQMKPSHRITPAGRFEADLFEKGRGRSSIWVDYDAAIAMHKIALNFPKQHRPQRMASANPADHRITYGCINVPAAFYDEVLYPAFKPKDGIVYVLPDKLPLEAVFKSLDTGDRIQLRQARYIAR